MQSDNVEGEQMEAESSKRSSSRSPQIEEGTEDGLKGSRRVYLACMRCREKKTRCPGDQPTCQSCVKAGTVCEWPLKRRKKRTRKEIEEDKKWLEAGFDTFITPTTTFAPKPNNPRSKPNTSIKRSNTQSSLKLDLGDHDHIPWHGPGPGPGPGLATESGSSHAGHAGHVPGALGDIDTSHLSISDDAAASLGFNLGWLDFWNNSVNGMPSPHDGTHQLPHSFFHPLSTDHHTSIAGPSTSPSSLLGLVNPTLPRMASNEGSEAHQPIASGSNSTTHPQMYQPETLASHGAMDPRLINAVQRQAAFIEGDPKEDEDLELFYYHFSGPTSIRPGLNRIALRLQKRPGAANNSPLSLDSKPSESASELSRTPVPHPEQLPQDLWDSSGMPLPHIRDPLLDLFFKHVSQFFPSLSRQRVKERIETETLSAFLTNCACALGARFAEAPLAKTLVRDYPTVKQDTSGAIGSAAAAPFMAKAQELIIPLLHLPTHDVCTGLLYLAWASYGQNSEAGLWQFGGMAFRMAIDLGIHEDSTIYESMAHLTRTRLLFWNLFITDRVIAFVTGRPVTIPDELIEIPLPEDGYLYPDPARNTSEYLQGGTGREHMEPTPFVQLVKLMVICGRISDLLNGRRGRPRTLVNKVENLTERLSELQVELVSFISALPPNLQWSAENFSHHADKGHGGIYLTLHLWANAVVAFVYHPELLKSPSGIETPLTQNMSRNMSLSVASSRQICECLVFADLVKYRTYTTNPFVVQPLFVAAMTLILEIRSTEAQANLIRDQYPRMPEESLLLSMTRQNLSVIINALDRMELYWTGIGTVLNLLEQRSGVMPLRPRGTRSIPYISLPDQGVLRRFKTDRTHPHSVAPADENSLQASIARGNGGDPSPVQLADFMAGYTVEGMSFGPADEFDFERLLSQA